MDFALLETLVGKRLTVSFIITNRPSQGRMARILGPDALSAHPGELEQHARTSRSVDVYLPKYIHGTVEDGSRQGKGSEAVTLTRRRNTQHGWSYW